MNRRYLRLESVVLLAIALTCLSLQAQETVKQRIEVPIAPRAEQRDATVRKLQRQGRLDLINDVPVEQGDAAVRRRLAAKTDIRVQKMPLAQFARYIESRHKVPIRLDGAALKRADVEPNAPITASFRQVTLDAALRQILAGLKLQYLVVGGAVVITDRSLSPAAAANRARIAGVRRGQMRAPPVGDFEFKNPAAAVKNAEDQVLQRLRPVLQVELNLVKTVCAPTKEQLRLLRKDAEQHLKGTANEFAEWPNGRVRWLQKPAANVRTRLQVKLAASIESRLSLAQAARYRSEVEKHNASRRQVCVRNLVATLDQELCLTSLQRDELSESLSWNWNDSWCQAVEMSAVQGRDYVPAVPDELVVHHLDATQKDLWREMRKIGNGAWASQVAFFGMRLENVDDDE